MPIARRQHDWRRYGQQQELVIWLQLNPRKAGIDTIKDSIRAQVYEGKNEIRTEVKDQGRAERVWGR